METKVYVSESGERASKITKALIKSGFEFLHKDNDKKNRLEKIRRANEYIIIVDSSQSTDNLVQWEWSNILEAIWDQPEKKVIPVISNDVPIPSFLYDWEAVRYSSSDKEYDISEKVMRAFINVEKDVKIESVKDIDKGCYRLSRLIFLEQQADLLAKSEAILNRDKKVFLSRNKHRGDINSQFEAYKKLGAKYISNGRLDKAAECYTDTLKKFAEATLSADDIANVYLKLGHVFRKQKRFKEAVETLEHAIVMNEKSSNVINTNMLAIKVELAEVLYESNNLEAAQNMLENIIDEGRKSLGNLDPTIASSYQKLGLIAKKSRQYEKAQEHFEKAVEMISKSMGIGNPQVTEAYLNLINVSKFTQKPTDFEKNLKADSIIFTSHFTKECSSKTNTKNLIVSCANCNSNKKNKFDDKDSIVSWSINQLISATKPAKKKKTAINFSSNVLKGKTLEKKKCQKCSVDNSMIGGEFIE